MDAGDWVLLVYVGCVIFAVRMLEQIERAYYTKEEIEAEDAETDRQSTIW